MLNAFLTVVSKVIVLFLMIGAGYGCYKSKLISSRGASQFTNLLMYVVTPCLIISSFQIDNGDISLQKLGICALVAIVGHLIPMGISFLVYRKKEEQRKKVLRFALVYSNVGFMGLPLVQAVLGETGVVYTSVYVVVFIFFVWTHGYISLSGQRDHILKKVLLNPGTIGVAVGLPLFAFHIQLPEILGTVMDSFAALNTPLSMVIIGTYIAQVRWDEFFSDKEIYSVMGIRLVLAPLIFMLLMYPLRLDPMIFVTCCILAGAPVAGNTVIFAVMVRNKNAKLASKMVAVSTLFSILTMPLFTVAAQSMVGMI